MCTKTKNWTTLYLSPLFVCAAPFSLFYKYIYCAVGSPISSITALVLLCFLLLLFLSVQTRNKQRIVSLLKLSCIVN